MNENMLMFGVAYYPEYMPHERMDQDFAMMKKAGINTIRVQNLHGVLLSLWMGSSTFIILIRFLKKRRPQS